MKNLLITITVTCTLACLPAVATAQIFWDEDFDSYPAGGLIGNGGWTGWDGNPSFDANVVNTISLSAPNSVEIVQTSDVVQAFTGATYGQWLITAWCYIPANSTGEQFWIMLNQYAPGGTQNWSLQVLFDMSLGEVQDYNSPATLPIVYDQWIELRVEIDLDADLQTVFYDNQRLFADSWTGHVGDPGILQIAALDLFSNGGSPIYWDDIILAGPDVVAAERTSWGELKSSYR